MKFFTSDTHFGHTNIIRFSNRPFATVEEMDETLIRRWNERVAPNDDVYHLGDFVFGDRKVATPRLLSRLNGRIHIHWGNHDHTEIRRLGHLFASAQHVSEIQEGEDRIFLSHYAHRVWNGSHRGSYHLWGHSHGCLPAWGRSLDVGVDCWDFAPVTFAEIKRRLAALGTMDEFKDHHPEVYGPTRTLPDPKPEEGEHGG